MSQYRITQLGSEGYPITEQRAMLYLKQTGESSAFCKFRAWRAVTPPLLAHVRRILPRVGSRPPSVVVPHKSSTTDIPSKYPLLSLNKDVMSLLAASHEKMALEMEFIARSLLCMAVDGRHRRGPCLHSLSEDIWACP